MCNGMDESKMACKGAPTITRHTGTGDMEECQACGEAVAHDLVDHAFFGFASSCPRKRLVYDSTLPEEFSR